MIPADEPKTAKPSSSEDRAANDRFFYRTPSGEIEELVGDDGRGNRISSRHYIMTETGGVVECTQAEMLIDGKLCDIERMLKGETP